MEAMLQRVFKVTTLCMDTRSQSLFSAALTELRWKPKQLVLLKNDFFDIPQLQYVGEVGKLTTF